MVIHTEATGHLVTEWTKVEKSFKNLSFQTFFQFTKEFFSMNFHKASNSHFFTFLCVTKECSLKVLVDAPPRCR